MCHNITLNIFLSILIKAEWKGECQRITIPISHPLWLMYIDRKAHVMLNPLFCEWSTSLRWARLTLISSPRRLCFPAPLFSVAGGLSHKEAVLTGEHRHEWEEAEKIANIIRQCRLQRVFNKSHTTEKLFLGVADAAFLFGSCMSVFGYQNQRNPSIIFCAFTYASGWEMRRYC